MNGNRYREYRTDQLVELYQRAASEHGRADAQKRYRQGNPAADRIAAIYHEIRNRGVEHQRALLPLLLSDDTGVRCWAAAHALEFEPRQGEAVLLEIARGKGMDGFSARMTLKLWHEDKLQFP